ncbi:hypothetical protein ACFE04_023277 [Oxalis oulophora]
MCCFYAAIFIHGFCLPCCPFVVQLLKSFNVASSQIPIGGSFVHSMLRITRTSSSQRLFGHIPSKYPDNRKRFFFLKKAGGWLFRNFRTMRNIVKRTKDDEVRTLVAWVGWVDGYLLPSAQDYLVSRRNAFFFCEESDLFLPFVFPCKF